MKKSAITLESLNTTIESLDKKFDQVLEHIQVLSNKVEGNTQSIVQNTQSIVQNTLAIAKNTLGIVQNTLGIDDNTSSIQHLIESALMRNELQPIIHHEITQSESRMISHMEGFIRRHITMEEEVLIHGAKIRVIEQVLGLPNIA